MQVKVKKDLDSEFVPCEIEAGWTLEKIYREKVPKVENNVFIAKVDNKYKELTEEITQSCNIEFLDIKSQAGRLVYQHSLIMIYLKAVEDVMGRTDVRIESALGKGLYTEIDSAEEISGDMLSKIEDRMWTIHKANIPFIRKKVGADVAAKMAEEASLLEKKCMVEVLDEDSEFAYYDLDGFYNFFYGYMVPSTGYIDGFSLRKYNSGVMILMPDAAGDNFRRRPLDDRKLFAAFSEAKRWHDLLDIAYVWDLNQMIVDGKEKEIIQLSEALHEQKIIEIAKAIMEQKKRIILISGPSSSGKTTFARRLCVQLRVNGVNPLYMGTDDYFLDRAEMIPDEKGELDFEAPEAVDIEKFNKHLNALLSAKEVDIPRFDFIEGKKKFGERIIKIEKDTPIVIEGIHALNAKLTPRIDDGEKYKIYISPLTQLAIDRHNRISTTDSRMLRRLVRDYKYRGYSAEKTIREWPKVRLGEDKNIFPFNGEADIFFNSTHIYELCVLKKYAKPLLENIKREDEEYAEARRMLDFLRFFKTIKQDDCIGKNSILREFIGGSIFVD